MYFYFCCHIEQRHVNACAATLLLCYLAHVKEWVLNSAEWNWGEREAKRLYPRTKQNYASVRLLPAFPTSNQTHQHHSQNCSKYLNSGKMVRRKNI